MLAKTLALGLCRKHTTGYLPNMPYPTGPTALPATVVSAALPMLAMVEDVVWRLRWRKVMSDEFYYASRYCWRGRCVVVMI
jgi:hypothetical protein